MAKRVFPPEWYAAQAARRKNKSASSSKTSSSVKRKTNAPSPSVFEKGRAIEGDTGWGVEKSRKKMTILKQQRGGIVGYSRNSKGEWSKRSVSKAVAKRFISMQLNSGERDVISRDKNSNVRVLGRSAEGRANLKKYGIK